MRSDLLDLTVFLHHETGAAVLVSDDGEEKNAVWLPRSQIEIEQTREGRTIIVTVPEWLAMDKGLI